MDYEVLLQKDPDRASVEDDERQRIYPPQRYSSQRRISVSIFTLLGLSSATLISVLLLLVLYMLHGNRQCSVQDSTWKASRAYLGGDMSQMGLDHENDYMWKVFEPETQFGLIYKENPDTAGMISMFHQMQCLAVFRQVLQAQREGLDIRNDNKEIPHAQHCLDYMYQTLSCSADDTIEWEIPTIPRTKHITGMDTPRMCRNSSKLVKQACEARKVYIEHAWTDGPLPKICEVGDMPW